MARRQGGPSAGRHGRRCFDSIHLGERGAELVAIEATDLAVPDNGHRYRPKSAGDQLLVRLIVLVHVSHRERHAVLGKKLFHLIAGVSARTGVDHDVRSHDRIIAQN